MSPGNLYRYFRSKEDDHRRHRGARPRRGRAAVRGGRAAADFFDGLAALAQHHLVERSIEEVALCAEIMAESRRNPAVARIYQDMEADVRAALHRDAAQRGRARRNPPRYRFRRRRDGAVRARRRPVVAARGRAVVQRRSRDAARARMVEQLARTRTGERQQDRGHSHESVLVLPPSAWWSRAGAWIASGHLFPHETRGEPRRGRSRRGAQREAVPRLGDRRAASSRAAASSCCPAAPRPTGR